MVRACSSRNQFLKETPNKDGNVVVGVPSGILVRDLFTENVPKGMWDFVWIRMRGRVADFVYCEKEAVEHDTLKDPDDKKKKLWYYPVIPLNSPRLESWSSAMDVRVIPSEELFEGCLGIYGKKFQRYKVSDTQRSTILMLKLAGVHGVPQNELSAKLGKGPNNFGYVMTTLEERGKIFKKRANVRIDGGRAVATSVVWLSCFRPVVEANIANSSVISYQDNNGKQVEMEFVQEEDTMMRVLGYLDSQAQDGTAVESTLKLQLGYKDKSGHKVWRRVREKMIDLGLISSFEGVLEKTGTNERFIRKLKNLEIEVAPETIPSVVHSPPRLPIQQIVELSLDRQTLLDIVKHGREGVNSSELGTHLGLSLKKHSVRFQDLIEHRFQEENDYSIKQVKVTVDKSSQKAYRILDQTAEMILAANKALFPNGYSNHVTRGVGTDDSSIDATILELVENAINASEGKSPVSETFMNRLCWLLEIVNKNDFILGPQVNSYLLQREKDFKSKKGGEVPKDIDNKIVGRIAEFAERNHLIKTASLDIPGRTIASGVQKILVYSKPDADISDDMYRRIEKAYEEMFQSRRPKKDTNVNKTIVSGEFTTLKINKGQAFDMNNIQLANGLLPSKLLRYQVITEALVRMIESRDDLYVTGEFEKLLVAADAAGTIRCIQEIPEVKVFTMGAMQSKTKDITFFDPTSENKRLVFTRDELWDALTVQDFISALGSVCKDESYLEDNKNRLVSELSQNQLIRIAGDPDRGLAVPQKHFRTILNELRKLGVIKSISITDENMLPHRISKSLPGEKREYYMLSNHALCEHLVVSSSAEDLPENQGPRRSVMSFSLLDAEERHGYWIRLQCIFAKLPRYLQNLNSTSTSVTADSNHCFPADRMNVGKVPFSADDLERVKGRIRDENININEISLDWRGIDMLSSRWNLPVETVIRGLSDVSSNSKKTSNRSRGLTGERRQPGARNKRKRSRNTSNSAAANEEEEEEEEEEMILLQPESVAPPTRKRKWLENQDRELLLAWSRYLAHNGTNCNIQWKKMGVPSGMNESKWKKRISKLSSTAIVEDHMKAIKEESEKVYQRKKDLGVSQKMQSNQPFGAASLFEVQTDEDLLSARKILSEIEKVITVAPERTSDGNDTASARHERLAKSQPDGTSPSTFLAWLQTYIHKSKAMSGVAWMPNLEVATATSFILSLLYELEYMNKSESIAQEILAGRFSEDTCRAALRNLIRNGLITENNNGETNKMTFHLSSRYKSEMKPPFAPGILQENTNVLDSALDGKVWPLRQQKHISVMYPLTEAIMEHSEFQVSVPEGILGAFKESKNNENASYKLGQHCLQRNMASVRLRDVRQNREKQVSDTKEQSCIVYQPKDVLDSSEIYKKAKTDFLEESAELFGANVGNSILDTISKSGPNGVAMSTLSYVLLLNNLTVDTSSIERLLQKFGLVRIIDGYNEKHIVSSLTSSHLVLKKESGNSSSPMKEVPMTPWTSSDGEPLAEKWNSLVHRIVSIVETYPGIDGEKLIEAMHNAVTPLQAKEIIHRLWKEGVLYYLEKSNPLNVEDMFKDGIFSNTFKYGTSQRSDTTSLWSLNEKNPPFQSRKVGDHMFFVTPHKINNVLQKS